MYILLLLWGVSTIAMSSSSSSLPEVVEQDYITVTVADKYKQQDIKVTLLFFKQYLPTGVVLSPSIATGLADIL